MRVVVMVGFEKKIFELSLSKKVQKK